MAAKPATPAPTPKGPTGAKAWLGGSPTRPRQRFVGLDLMQTPENSPCPLKSRTVLNLGRGQPLPDPEDTSAGVSNATRPVHHLLPPALSLSKQTQGRCEPQLGRPSLPEQGAHHGAKSTPGHTSGPRPQEAGL